MRASCLHLAKSVASCLFRWARAPARFRVSDPELSVAACWGAAWGWFPFRQKGGAAGSAATVMGEDVAGLFSGGRILSEGGAVVETSCAGAVGEDDQHRSHQC